jgi:hypothetical protein
MKSKVLSSVVGSDWAKKPGTVEYLKWDDAARGGGRVSPMNIQTVMTIVKISKKGINVVVLQIGIRHPRLCRNSGLVMATDQEEVVGSYYLER